METNLIRVVQRIPQYNMLLGDFLKNTWADHPDYENVKKAATEMQKTGQLVNEYIRTVESLNKVLDLNFKILKFPELAIPGRLHVYDAHVREMVEKPGNV